MNNKDAVAVYRNVVRTILPAWVGFSFHIYALGREKYVQCYGIHTLHTGYKCLRSMLHYISEVRTGIIYIWHYIWHN